MLCMVLPLLLLVQGILLLLAELVELLTAAPAWPGGHRHGHLARDQRVVGRSGRGGGHGNQALSGGVQTVPQGSVLTWGAHILVTATPSGQGFEGHLGGADGDGYPSADGAPAVGRLGGGLAADGGGV